jgi:hypothetical protein
LRPQRQRFYGWNNAIQRFLRLLFFQPNLVGAKVGRPFSRILGGLLHYLKSYGNPMRAGSALGALRFLLKNFRLAFLSKSFVEIAHRKQGC